MHLLAEGLVFLKMMIVVFWKREPRPIKWHQFCLFTRQVVFCYHHIYSLWLYALCWATIALLSDLVTAITETRYHRGRRPQQRRRFPTRISQDVLLLLLWTIFISEAVRGRDELPSSSWGAWLPSARLRTACTVASNKNYRSQREENGER